MTGDSNTAYGFGLEQARDINKATGIVLGTVGGGRAGVRETATAARSIVVELLAELPADDYELHDARQVTWNGSEWVPVSTRPVPVRKITAAAIAAGSADDPTRLKARPIANLGWCVGEPAGEPSTTVIGGTSGDCCGCNDPETVNYYNYDGENLPRVFRVSGVSLACCANEAGYLDLQRAIPNGVQWEAVQGCADGATILWQLDPGVETLTATHSEFGQVAQFDRNTYDAGVDLFCNLRFDRTAAALRRDCVVCGEQACVTPYPLDDPPEIVSGCQICTDNQAAKAYEVVVSGMDGPVADYFNGATLVTQLLGGQGYYECRRFPYVPRSVVHYVNPDPDIIDFEVVSPQFGGHIWMALNGTGNGGQANMAVYLTYTYHATGFSNLMEASYQLFMGTEHPCLADEIEFPLTAIANNQPTNPTPPPTTFPDSVILRPVSVGLDA